MGTCISSGSGGGAEGTGRSMLLLLLEEAVLEDVEGVGAALLTWARRGDEGGVSSRFRRRAPGDNNCC